MMKILVVINGDASDPIDYSSPIKDDNYIEAVETWFKERQLEVDSSVVEEIAQELAHGRCEWYEGTYCFSLVYV